MANEEFSIIPVPLQVHRLTGEFILTAGTKILVEPDNEPLTALARAFAQQLQGATGYELTWDTTSIEHAPKGTIFVKTTVDNQDPAAGERYTLEVLPRAVTISASTPAGVSFGLQTLRQLFTPEIESRKPVENVTSWTLPAVRIVDEPRYRWRGLMLDTCRHFLGKDFILGIIDLLAFHKLNVLHWHLTDDQGWRIEIKKYPKLTETGAFRVDDRGARYGGYYTQESVREVVSYAADRGITVVPGIEMPGHSVAALASYPKLSCTGNALPVATRWGVFEDIICAGSEYTYEFIGNVLAEVAGLFPGEYVHVGGDHCPLTRWEECRLCRERIESDGLDGTRGLSTYFLNQVASMLETHGRRLIGWDDALRPGITQSAVFHALRGADEAAAAARTGHDVVVSPSNCTCLDKDMDEIDLATVYRFDPVPNGLPAGATKHILGGECILWTEHVSRNLVHKKLFPRLAAFAEVMWSAQESTSFEDFQRRLLSYYERLDRLGIEHG